MTINVSYLHIKGATIPQSEAPHDQSPNGSTERSSMLSTHQDATNNKPSFNHGPPPAVSPRPHVKPRMVSFLSYTGMHMDFYDR